MPWHLLVIWYRYIGSSQGAPLDTFRILLACETCQGQILEGMSLQIHSYFSQIFVGKARCLIKNLGTVKCLLHSGRFQHYSLVIGTNLQECARDKSFSMSVSIVCSPWPGASPLSSTL